jgi:RNA polymerase sigma-70 factor (ECF subfamily)
MAVDSDIALARAPEAGDLRLRRELVDRLLDRVRTTVRYLVAHDRDADDLVQLSLMEILRSVDSFRGESRIEAWADRITIRTSMRALRRRRLLERRVVLDDEGSAVEAVADEVGQEQALVRLRMRRRLADLLQRLSPERRVVVLLRWVHGYSVKEIAALTGAPVNTVRDRLQVGKRQLRKLILTDPLLCEWAGTTDR